MRRSADIAGEMGQDDRLNWAPLLALVGEELTSEFMWMYDIELADGALVHAYKHIETRRYLHLAEDGSTLRFTAPGHYEPIDRHDALVEAFYQWERFADERYSDVEVLRAALRQAYRAALGDQPAAS